jgi:hypothetical protein
MNKGCVQQNIWKFGNLFGRSDREVDYEGWGEMGGLD